MGQSKAPVQVLPPSILPSVSDLQHVVKTTLPSPNFTSCYPEQMSPPVNLSHFSPFWVSDSPRIQMDPAVLVLAMPGSPSWSTCNLIPGDSQATWTPEAWMWKHPCSPPRSSSVWCTHLSPASHSLCQAPPGGSLRYGHCHGAGN